MVVVSLARLVSRTSRRPGALLRITRLGIAALLVSVLGGCYTFNPALFLESARRLEDRPEHRAMAINLSGNYNGSSIWGAGSPEAAESLVMAECAKYAKTNGYDPSECHLVSIDDKLYFDPILYFDSSAQGMSDLLVGLQSVRGGRTHNTYEPTKKPVVQDPRARATGTPVKKSRDADQ